MLRSRCRCGEVDIDTAPLVPSLDTVLADLLRGASTNVQWEPSAYSTTGDASDRL